MADNTNDLQISLGLDPTDYMRGLSEAERLTQQGASRIQTAISGISDVGQQLAGLGATLTASITLPIIALGKEAINAYGDLQALELGIEAVAGSATFAGKQMAELREIAKLPGLGLKEAANGSIGLQAIGYSAGNAEKILLQFGNAIATVGKGREEFERAIYGVQQLANTDFPLGEDLNIIKDALPQVSTLLKAAFGTSRTEDLQKLGISSKQVMDVIIAGLEKLPRVSGGIKNAFENLGDSMQQNLARIGELIDDSFNISGIINKLTDFIDKIIDKFEELSPNVQKTILFITGLVAAIGPLILAIGGAMALLPTLTAGFTALGTAVAAATGPIGLIVTALATLGVGLYTYYSNIETAADRQERWNKTLSKATTSAQAEISALDALYKKTQDHSLSIEERTKAVDQAQKEYPGYLGNISNEAFLAGKAALSYDELRKGILKASLARAAQSEIDKRSNVRLEKELELREKFNKAVKSFKDPKPVIISISGGTGGIGTQITRTAEEVKLQSARIVLETSKAIRSLGLEFDKENKNLIDIIKAGSDDIRKLDIAGPDTFLPGLDKTKKKTQKQLAEIFPTQKELAEILPYGSIAELRQRSELLRKSIETSVGELVKVRGLDKFGKEVDKKGNPFYTGLVLPLDEAKTEFERLIAQISLLEAKPPSGIVSLKQFRGDFKAELEEINNIGKSINFSFGGTNPFIKFEENINKLTATTAQQITGRGLLDEFGNEFKSLNDLMSSETQRTADILGTDLTFAFTGGLLKVKQAIDAANLTERITKLNESLNNIVTDGVVNTISDSFASIGEAIANGTNVISAVGNILLSSFGKLLSTLGKQLIAYGIGLVAVKLAMKNPYLAIAAGAALVALGSALSASVNKTVNDSGIGGGSVSSSAGTGSSGGFSNTSYSQGGVNGGEVVFRISGPDLIGAINRNVSSDSRLTAG